MGKILGSLEPKPVWEYFEEICNHPHPSKKEHKLAAYILDFAKKYNLEARKDEVGNIAIRKPATPGMENRLPVCLQGHIDMVCEKNNDVTFDFDNDPIQLIVDGDWVKANGTTLGADNGIGVAMGMAVLASTDIPHPPMELLCTLDEETGLTGAQFLANDLLRCKVLINLDSEEDGTFTIGCAGGQNTKGTFKYMPEQVPADSKAYKVTVKGLRGGHSGIEIHDERGNAIKMLARVLFDAKAKFGMRLASFKAGSAHNAIPREAFAIVTIPAASAAAFEEFMKAMYNTMLAEYAKKEPNLTVVWDKEDLPSKVMAKEAGDKFINMLFIMPHGVVRNSPDIKGLVQTSTNLAVIETLENEITVLTSQRSSVESERPFIANRVQTVMEFGGGDVKQGDGYPAWQPNVNSEILKKGVEVHKELFGVEPHIQAIHAGLECGLIGEKYPGMDMLSFGPNLLDVHSPDERVQISTTQKCWKLLLGILKNIPEA